MSPEQLQGKVTDVRADIFSFGCVLYEMLTGKRAFDGANTASVMAAILERPAPSVGEVAPALLDRILRRCLAKDPDERWQSAADLRAALEMVEQSGTGGVRADVESGGKKPVPTWLWIAAGVLGVALAGLALVHFREKPSETPVTRFTISPPEGAYLPSSGGPQGRPTLPALSPDGRKLVFRAVSQDGKGQLWIRSLDAVAAQPLEGTEGGVAPFWSPDGKSIGFSHAEAKLKRMESCWRAAAHPRRERLHRGLELGGNDYILRQDRTAEKDPGIRWRHHRCHKAGRHKRDRAFPAMVPVGRKELPFRRFFRRREILDSGRVDRLAIR